MKTYPDASTYFVASIMDSLEDLGISRGELERRLGAAALRGRAPEGRVSLGALGRLWPALESMTGRAGWGLRLAQGVNPEAWSVFGQSLRGSATLGDALVRAGRYLPLLVSAADLSLHTLSSGRSLIIFSGRSALTRHPESVEFALGAILRVAEAVVGGRIPVRVVRFAHASPRDGRRYEEVFGAPVEHRRANDALVVDSTVLLRVVPSHDDRLCEALDREVQARLTELPRRESVVRRTEALLRSELMASGAPTVHRVAAGLGMPPRTLSRRLRSEGATFQSLLDSLRLDLADRFLSEDGMTVTEVAHALGYSDPSAFNKAFRRWTGQAPHAYRRRVAPSP